MAIAQKFTTWLLRRNSWGINHWLYENQFIFNLVKTRPHHLWIIAAPKSGSTWLSRICEETLGWRKMVLLNSCGHREQELDLRKIAAYPSNSIFSPHQHCRCSDETLEVVEKAAIKSVITTRNIFDTVVSLVDHLDREDVIMPHAFMTQELWERLDVDVKRRFIVDMILPWYFNFYAGWFSHLQSSGRLPNFFVVRYEDLKSSPDSVVKEVMDWVGVDISVAEISIARGLAEEKETRKNKAVIGRGDDLSIELRAKINSMADFYPTIDFSSIGIR